MFRFIRKYSEVILWNGALLALGLMDVSNTSSLCIFKNLGIGWCPGCGLGHAIHHALHLNFAQSVHEHILGIPATLIIFYQSCKAIYSINKSNNKTNSYEPTTIVKDVS